MNAVTISAQFQIEIPPEVRAQAHLEAGQQVQVLAYDNRVELIPLQSAAQLRGFLRGIDTNVPREADRP
jgi:AbrB family looped-hinge helix DNA binding protein